MEQINEHISIQVVESCKKLRQFLPVKDRWVGLKKHHAVFTGYDLLDCLNEIGETQSPAEAVREAQKLQKAGFVECVDKESAIRDHPRKFFRFTPSAPDVELGFDQRPEPPMEAHIMERAVAAVMGGFVSDAAASGMNNRIKNRWDRATAMKNHNEIEFCDSIELTSNKFDGELSAYGYEATVLLRSLLNRGELRGPYYAKDSFLQYSTNRCVINAISRKFYKKMDAGVAYPYSAVSSQKVDFLAKVPLNVARYAGTGKLTEKIKEAVSVHQSHPHVAETAIVSACILERIVLGHSIKNALAWAVQPKIFHQKYRNILHKAIRSGNMNSTDAIQQFGMGSSLPGGFQSIIQILVKCTGDYPTAIRSNIIAGGKCSSRAIYLGACLAAEKGINAIPLAWKEKTKRYGTLRHLTRAMVSRRCEGINAIEYDDKSSLWKSFKGRRRSVASDSLSIASLRSSKAYSTTTDSDDNAEALYQQQKLDLTYAIMRCEALFEKKEKEPAEKVHLFSWDKLNKPLPEAA